MLRGVTMYHNPVLLHESIDALAIKADGIYVDATFGGGGHSRLILSRLNEKGRLLGFDQDKDSVQNKIDDSRFEFIGANFTHLTKFLKYHQAYPVHGILADLGVSSFQIDTPERGFSYRYDAPLDMRMNQRKELTAQEVVNSYSEEQLADIFFKYGELKNGRKIASLIKSGRAQTSIKTTEQLVKILEPILFHGKENKILAQIFQAIRIEVNKELEVLESFLEQTVDALLPGGRLVIISYHSLEDRLVKKIMRSGNCSGKIEKDFFGNPLTPFKLITKKAIVADEAENIENPRARSAKLRVAEKIDTKDEINI
ncbi:MAG TPA: 16S rRNA (cytosine(1402)-N(4))-methyltransferase RsmH [Bacteroidales bacterium]|nr:16S rRNA (cytosine(1402)-N(4))-methyltransferase RsmH [Bacteroidales bacterium]HOS58126.1 16S rRNA (cytosine(1402)-N(4))-methyltransferase RsmH [Bacteroidales bacterium]HRT14028.1 16S rRNA (cytosine(1402)-N(4))-methyltransferase RsmH [Bacteroidales bacterium]HXK74141.1 16S rRNA (cytosine(1402)-N(4))-methyltransferase RsmH [Bacteroidales bacterium]